jgi:site-specific recombinase XerD
VKHTNVTSRSDLLGPALQRYFCHYLIGQRNLSPRTISSYRDCFKLLIRFMEHRGIRADGLGVADLDAPNVLAFLEDLERRRGNTARSRNARLAAIRSFLRHAASADPLLLSVAQRVCSIPVKRFEGASVGHLTCQQMQVVLDAPDGL